MILSAAVGCYILDGVARGRDSFSIARYLLCRIRAGARLMLA